MKHAALSLDACKISSTGATVYNLEGVHVVLGLAQTVTMCHLYQLHAHADLGVHA